jgi:phosphoenolpyruvate phosphomutase
VKPSSPHKTTALRRLIQSGDTQFLLEAHSALSARIAEEAGFRGIWASGLGISAQCGVRDHNELSWTQVLEIVELMADATSVPILLDGDTGYGDFNNLRRLVRKLERSGGAGVCIEDKLFPKTNSFIEGERQPLAAIDEFCGKLKAGKDSQLDPDFCIVARVEALIAGWGMDEALRRAEAYHAAGADAILIHSKRADPGEIVAFAQAWQGRAPLAIVPTTYAGTPTAVFRRLGIGLVIWANALVRASIAAMQRTARAVHGSESLVDVEGEIAPLREIFRLQGADELLRAERLYAPAAHPRPRVVILAATRGEGLEPVTAERPKVMLPVAGRPLLRHLVDAFKGEALHDVFVVAGYKSEAVDTAGVQLLHNPDHASSGELRSLRCALAVLDRDALVLYGDLLFRPYVLRDLLQAPGDVVAVVDSAAGLTGSGTLNDLAYCSAPDDHGLYRRDVRLERVSRDRRWQGREPDGRWIGMAALRGSAPGRVRELLAELEQRPDFDRLGMPDLLNALGEAGLAAHVLYIHGHWLDVNDLADLERANAFASAHRLAAEPT